jgi:hypothetical protein
LACESTPFFERLRPGMTANYIPPVCASTITIPVMCGCSEQKYLKVPGVVNVNENFPSVSMTFERNAFGDTTV